ncbi:unnamed protein product [Moneuplotes crassus]|uniref:Programmed cell death protein 2 C-terminal domain-containing protein n=1 Tax=Euplotes crassus TaxID=5936 RepID=A0AAD1UG59_EUPCR|nr:unnamed protein product [Moneuplotes crassus]
MEKSVPTVSLGFLEKPQNKLATKSLYFPSFIGGAPAFICKEGFIPDMTVCSRCNARLTFIGQIYCPLGEKEETFHRMLYIYACLKGKCVVSCESVRVFRCSLAQSNKYFSELPPNYSLLELSDAAIAEGQKDVLQAILAGEREYPECFKTQEESKKLSSVYLLGIEDEPSRVTKKIFKKQLILEKGDAEIEDYDSDDSCVLSKADREILEKHSFDDEALDAEEKKHAKELLQKYVENEASSDPNFEQTKKLLENPDEEDKEDDEEGFEEFVDEIDSKKSKFMTKEFEIFLDATKTDPSQVVRYCAKGMLPLWSSQKYRLKSSNVPKCENCGSNMTLEAQIMPALYNYVNELVNLNWNSIMIYTCEESCNPSEGEYVEEFAYVELIHEEERTMDMDNSDALLAAMTEGKKKPVKPGKSAKVKAKEAEEKAKLDEKTEAKLKEQLDDLQLDLD